MCFYLTVMVPGRWIFDGPASFFYIILTYLASGVMANLELLICLDRTWAAFAPHHYRTHHSAKLTSALCLISWIVGCIITVLFVLLTRTTYEGKHRNCRPQLTVFPHYTVYTRLLGAYMYLPVFVILLTYPVLPGTMDFRSGTTEASGKSQTDNF